MLDAARIRIGEPLVLEIRDGVIRLRRRGPRRPTLEEMIAATPNFEHPAAWLEDDVGREVLDSSTEVDRIGPRRGGARVARTLRQRC